MAGRTITTPPGVALTSYKVHSRESCQRSWWPFTAFAMPIIAVTTKSFSSRSEVFVQLRHVYETYQEDRFIVVSALCVAILLLYGVHYIFSTWNQTRDVDLIVTICPLGVQRSKITTMTYNHDEKHRRIEEHYYPLLPIEVVKDCILLEHVGAFSVTTHVMIRLKGTSDDSCEGIDDATKKQEDSTSGMVSAFPDAKLTFRQCNELVQQIRGALDEVL